MTYRTRILTPGPVELHPKALEALSRPQLHHRSDQAIGVFNLARTLLKQAFGTAGETLLVTGSGTAAMEALVLSLFAPGQRVWVPVHGKFSERWAEIAGVYGLEVVKQELPWGSAVKPGHIDEIEGHFDGALLTHSESSTGALNDIRALAQAFKSRFPYSLVLADMITSLLMAEVGLEDWGIDAAAAGSQKGIMCPPGLGYAALSPRALERVRPAGYYLSLARELKTQPSGESAWTPAINLIAATANVLEVVLPEINAHLQLKAQQNHILYQAGEAVGLKVVPEVRSPATTCFYLPQGLKYAQVKDAFAKRGATIIGGQGQLKGKIFRVSLMGYSDLYDAYAVAQMMQEVARSL
jgi:aspartate aminotransferase-like enzyme